MKIGSFFGAAALYRREKVIYAHLHDRFRTLSTCRTHGGLREDIEYIFNHQSCEPSNHLGTDLCEVAVKDPTRYHRRICSKAGLPVGRSAGMGTAANMNNAAVAVRTFGPLEAIAICTAGVGGNGGRAGDPASYAQTEDGIQQLGVAAPAAGTINFILLLSQELSKGALVSAATLVAEAKASVLQELSAASRYSEGIATGTGTDQLAISCLLNTSVRHSDANKHSKAGEVIALAVRASLQQALNLQSGMTPDARRSCIAHLRRLGEGEDAFVVGVSQHLEADAAALFKSNFLAINHDPMTVAAVLSCLHARDQMAWGVIPKSCSRELLMRHCLSIASSVAGRNLDAVQLDEEIDRGSLDMASPSFLATLRWAFAFGFRQKWLRRFED